FIKKGGSINHSFATSPTIIKNISAIYLDKVRGSIPKLWHIQQNSHSASRKIGLPLKKKFIKNLSSTTLSYLKEIDKPVMVSVLFPSNLFSEQMKRPNELFF